MSKFINTNNITIKYNSFDEYLLYTPEPDSVVEHSWRLLPNILSAIEVIIQYQTKKILIVGDYDVDGTNATAVLLNGLKNANFTNVSYLIPDRLQDGYGITANLVKKIDALKPELIITVDNGITAINSILQLYQMDYKVIITDHHEPKPDGILPVCEAVIDPKLQTSEYPFKDICGTVVAYKLIQGIYETLQLNFNKNEYLPYLTLATIADVMPLINENRTIVKNGLQQIASYPNTMYRAIFKVFGRQKIKQEHLKASDFGFYVGPLLNAYSRMTGKTDVVMQLLLSNSDDECITLVNTLLSYNEQRKLEEQKIQVICDNFVQSIYPEIYEHKEKYPIVIGHSGLHHGVLGINAAKTAEKYGVPTIILTGDKKDLKTVTGSARTYGNINLIELFKYCDAILEGYGGHTGAAGVAVDITNVKNFRRQLQEYSQKYLSDDNYQVQSIIDAKITANDITVNNARRLLTREPYGIGFNEPTFYSQNWKIIKKFVFGKAKNVLKLQLEQNGVFVDAIMFFVNMDTINSYQVNDVVDVVFNLNINNYRGNETVQLLMRGLSHS